MIRPKRYKLLLAIGQKYVNGARTYFFKKKKKNMPFNVVENKRQRY